MENLLFLGVPKSEQMCLNIGTPNNHYFPFGINEKVVVLGVPILKHFRVKRFKSGAHFVIIKDYATMHVSVISQEKVLCSI